MIEPRPTSRTGHRRPRRLASASLLLSMLGGGLLAQEPGIRVAVDRNPITIQDRAVLQVTVEGTRAAQPELPELADFRVVEAGQSTSVNMVNGRMSASVTFSYYLLPQRVGSFEIGAATVDIDGRLYRSQPFTLTVREASAETEASRDYFLTARVSDSDPYVGQQVIYTWRFYRRLYVEVGEARLTSLDFGDMVAEDLGEVAQFQTTLNGVEYTVSEIKKAVFPQRAGAVTIPPSELICLVAEPGQRRRRSIFDLGRPSMEQKVLRTAAIELEVRPLPAPPPSFSGLIGDFDIRSSISKRELKVGESTTLGVTIEGTGNVQMLNAPRFPELASFKVYDDKPSSSIDRSGGRLAGKKTYRRAMVPLVAGAQTIPPLELAYFDPEAGSYRTKRTAPIDVEVAPSETREELMLTESRTPTTGKVAVRVLGDDILPIRRGLDSLRGGPLQGVQAWAWGAGAVAPPLLFVALLLARRRQDRFAQDRGLRRRRAALRTALRKVKEIENNKVARYDPQTLAREACLCLRHYAGDKLDAEGGVLTPAEVERLLDAGGAEDATVRRTRELLERLEAAQYGAAASKLELEPLTKSLANLLKDLDRQIGDRPTADRGLGESRSGVRT